ncbi:hypothetical protein DMB92_05455 [Campylobacter sp. MIT 99-7217]|uniref:hypothetical protein n=1 Tax=Campylobacter sp. MIT 99-7217 TaxID=535091 RepID=UPI00115A6CA7|nr:hypothetical protein [Campylobacter sp. MIT 99-7217]TQR31834.1 hypothetical protein DMB92_05455 [Campylobacter sp. MIT 99-7217]
MDNNEFLKEKQNIREKMLRYSRAIREGRTPEDIDISSSDEILKKRVKNRKKAYDDFFNEEHEENNSKASIYLKEDLINIKLEEKKPFSLKFFSKLKRNKKDKNLKKQKEVDKKTHTLNLDQTSSKAFISSDQSQKIAFKNVEIPKKKDKVKKEEQAKFQDKNQNIQTKPKPQKKEKDKKITISKTEPEKESESKANTEVKSILLEGHTQAIKEERNLSFSHLLFAYLLVAFACIVFVPEVYIRTQIYYLSREIATLRSQESVLNEENKELKRKLEHMRFQNQILDYLD